MGRYVHVNIEQSQWYVLSVKTTYYTLLAVTLWRRGIRSTESRTHTHVCCLHYTVSVTDVPTTMATHTMTNGAAPESSSHTDCIIQCIVKLSVFIQLAMTVHSARTLHMNAICILKLIGLPRTLRKQVGKLYFGMG